MSLYDATLTAFWPMEGSNPKHDCLGSESRIVLSPAPSPTRGSQEEHGLASNSAGDPSAAAAEG